MAAEAVAVHRVLDRVVEPRFTVDHPSAWLIL